MFSFNEILLYSYCIMVVLMSIISIILYVVDKKKAVKGEMRIKEKTLLFSGVFFGAIGSLIGRLIAHHKTDKAYFSIVIIFSLIMQILTLGCLIYAATIL